MLIAGNIQKYYLHKAPEYIEPNAMECLEWKFNKFYTPPWLNHYIKNWILGPSQYAVVFVGNGGEEVDGVFKFNFQEKKQTLIAKGTLINPGYRKLGAAKKMWQMAIEETKPTKIVAFASTRDGLRFLKKMKKEFSTINWKIEETF